MEDRCLLIHGNSLAYKSYFSLASIPPEIEKRESVPLLFTKIIRRILKEYNPAYCAAAFDTPGPTPIKKSTLTFITPYPAMSDALLKELVSLKSILEALNIPVLQKKGCKASDIIGKLANISSKQNLETIVISSNKDVLQLISPHTKIINPFQDYKVYGQENIKEEFGVEPNQIPDFLALVGEKDGNIPGIEGIGEKGAVTLLGEYENIENIIENIDKMKETEKRNLLKKYCGRLPLYKKIAMINEKIPFDIGLEECRLKPHNSEKIKTVFQELGLVSLLSPFITFKKPDNVNYKTILTEAELDDLIGKMAKEQEISVDTETTSASPTGADLVGISISFKFGEAYYIPVSHRYLGVPKQLDVKMVLNRLRSVLGNPEIRKVGQNIKYDYIVLKRAGLQLENINFDTMIASYLLNPVRGEHNLSHLALQYLGLKMLSYEELVGEKKTIAEIKIEEVTYYSCEDADFTLRIKGKLLPLLKKEQPAGKTMSGFEELLHNIEMPLVPILGDMEISGVKVDRKYLSYLSGKLGEEINKISEQVYGLAGEKFNLNSTQQLSCILFEKLKLAPDRKSKTGYYSTSLSVLESIRNKHPVVEKIIEYRNLSKLKDGFVEPLINSVNPETGRIHTSFHQIGTSTGRLASSNPNLQNIPVRGERGKDLRKVFIAEEGNLLLSADYSQIELRIMAHFSGDELLTRAFQEDKDIHTETASILFNIPENKVTQDDRRKAKAVNFGIIYGISPYGLAQNIGVEEREARKIIENYFSTHHRVRKFIDELLVSAREKGYVNTLMGRKRWIPNIKSDNYNLRSQAEREAINTPIQGTAAEVIKIAMINIHRRLKEKKLNTKMLLQIHDELLLEVPPEEIETSTGIVKECMENAVRLNIPLKVSINTGKSWFEAH